MKKNSNTPADDKNKPQANIGYENTQTRNDGDDRENKRMKPATTGMGEGPKEKEDDTAGLRSESGSKTLGKKSGNKKKE